MHAELSALVGRVAAEGAGPAVVVLDLDSTLIDTRPRHLRILRAFAQAHGAAFPGLLGLVQGVSAADFRWSVGEPLLAAGMVDGALHEALHAFWLARFFEDAWLADDAAVPGAVAYARALHQAGALLVYLTARPAQTMARGTVASLLGLGFPLLEGRAILQLKADAAQSDAAYKASALDAIEGLRGRVLGTFENEPGHANRFARRWPGALHVLLETTHSPDAPAPLPQLVRVRDFLEG